ncbi:MAG: protein kinase [Planctomycetes bacterium]|nr:protein kinase [Planctomycetota bacterium]
MFTRDHILALSSVLDQGAIAPAQIASCLKAIEGVRGDADAVLGRLVQEGLASATQAALPPPSASATQLVESAIRALDPRGALPDTRADRLAPGERFGPFVIELPLGWGGMGTVYLARHTELERPVALKVISPEALGNPGSAVRFLREARLAARVRHPRVVSVHSAGQVDGVHYIEMERVDGTSLDHVLAQGQLAVNEAVRIILQAAEGLAAAHTAGVVHRDVKPGNLLVQRDGGVKVSDFGLARSAAEQGMALTRAGQVIGSPHYMAPEQVRGQEVDARADVYSLGATLYHSLTGRPPFEGEGVMELLQKQLRAEPLSPRARNPAVPETLCVVLSRMMAKEPASRYPGMAAVQAVLAPFARAPEAAPDEAQGTAGGPAPGGRFGPYRLYRLLGEGGMGQVWLAEREGGGAPVALKLLRGTGGSLARTRFEREARSAAAVDHPAVVRVLEFALESEPAWIAMEYVRGRTLRERIDAEGPLLAGEAMALLAPCLEGLSAAHARGIVHRDIKPENLLLPEGGGVKIADFGLAKSTEDREALTLTGTAVGTPYYMAPEQCSGDAVDERTDLYSLGASFYHALAGRPPFDADTQMAVLMHHLETAPRPLLEAAPGVPEGLAALVENLLAKQPRRRYASAAAALADLGRVTEGRGVRRSAGAFLPYGPRRRARRSLVAVGLGSAALMAVVALPAVWWLTPVRLVLRSPEGPQGPLVEVGYDTSRATGVRAHWSVDGARTWLEATSAREPPAGEGRYLWDAGTDLGALAPRRRFPEVIVRLAPSRGEPKATRPFPVDLSSPPVIRLVEGPAGASWGQVRWCVAVEDAEGDEVALEARYSLDGVGGFPEDQTCSLLGAQAAPASPSPAAAREVWWDSERDLPEADHPRVVVAFWGVDRGISVRRSLQPAVSGPLRLYNTVPRVEALPIAGVASDRVDLELVLRDPGAQASHLEVEFSADDGATWRAATLQGRRAGALEASPEGTLHRLSWDAFADLGNAQVRRCRLRVRPMEESSGRPGPEAVVPAFRLDNRLMATVAGGAVREGAPALEAALGLPETVLAGPRGEVYVADALHQRVRLVNPTAEALEAFGVQVPPGAMTTVVGLGGAGLASDGDSALATQLIWPTGLAMDVAGDLYVADLGARRVYKVWRDSGVLETVAGNGGRGPARAGAQATRTGIGVPVDVAVDAAGTLWVLTAERQILAVDPHGRLRLPFEPSPMHSAAPAVLGRGISTTGFQVADVAPRLQAGPGGALVVADAVAGVVWALGTAEAPVRLWGQEVPPRGAVVVAGGGTGPARSGLAATACGLMPQGIAVEADGSLIVTDLVLGQVYRVDPEGRLVLIAGSGVPGSGGDGGPAMAAAFRRPSALAASPRGVLYLAEREAGRLRAINRDERVVEVAGQRLAPGVVATVAGNGAWSDAAPGEDARSACVSLPEELALGHAGSLYVGEAWRVRRIELSTGRSWPVAGDGSAPSVPGEGDGLDALRARVAPTSLALSPAGLLFFTDCHPPLGQARLRVVNLGTEPVDLSSGTLPGGHVQTLFTLQPLASGLPLANLRVATDPAGDVYLAVLLQSSWDPARGVVAGRPARTALVRFNPWARPIDRGGPIPPGGTASLGGEGESLEDGVAAPLARVGHVTALHVDRQGLLWVGEGGDLKPQVATRLRAFNLAPAPVAAGGVTVEPGCVRTVAGTGVDAWGVDGVRALEGGISGVRGVATAPDGSVYFTDLTYDRVRWIDPGGRIWTVAGVLQPVYTREITANGYNGDGRRPLDAFLNGVAGLARDDEGNLYVADMLNHRVRRFAH